jgi:hypothetical protein
VGVVARGGWIEGNPWPTVVATMSTAASAGLLLEGDTKVYSPLLDLPISGESPKLRFGRRHLSGAVPLLEAPP